MSLIDSSTIHPTRDRILVRRYTRPERFGSIVLPDCSRVEPTWNYWEVIRAGPAVDSILHCSEGMGRELAAGDIIKTPFRPGVPVGTDIDGRTELFMVAAEVERDVGDGRGLRKVPNVLAVYPKTWED